MPALILSLSRTLSPLSMRYAHIRHRSRSRIRRIILAIDRVICGLTFSELEASAGRTRQVLSLDADENIPL